MKVIVATNTRQVREWVENTDHHIGRWLNKNKEEIEEPSECAFFELANYTDAIQIPVALHELCYFNVLCDGKRMFSWDYGAEEAARSTRDV